MRFTKWLKTNVVKIELIIMKSKIFKILILFSLHLFFCDGNPPTEPSENHITFPVKVGNQWEYHSTSYDFNFRPDSVIKIIHPDTLKEKITIEITDKILLDNSVEAYVFVRIIAKNNSAHRYALLCD